MKTTCEQCKQDFDATGSRGRTPKYCSNRCRTRACRARNSGIPELMKARATWCRADGKRPITRDGAPASSTNPATWDSFGNVRAGSGDGFGIMLGDGLGCYDLDHCYDGKELSEWGQNFIHSITEPVVYIEKSVSGDGLHVFVESPEKPGRRMRYRGGSIEFYSRQRFIRTTLNTVRG
ncbi:hypothetical protein ACQZES_05480 [Corynebacterium diphtheriae]